jgi:hypothetical protein
VLYGPGGTVRVELAVSPSGIKLYSSQTNTVSYLPPVSPSLLKAASLLGDGFALYQAALRRHQGVRVTGLTTLGATPVYRLLAALHRATVTVLIDRHSYRPLQITTVQRDSGSQTHFIYDGPAALALCGSQSDSIDEVAAGAQPSPGS